MRIPSMVSTLVALGVLAYAPACGSCDDEGGEPRDRPADENDDPPAEPDQPPTGSVEGIVTLADDTELPSYPPPSGPPRVAPPESCTPPQLDDRTPVRMDGDRHLEGVLLQASGFEAEITRPAVTHDVFIRDCRLTPRLIVAVEGDKVKITNETDYPFLPTMGSGMMQAIMRGSSRELPLPQGGIFELACGFAAPCGRTDVVVAYHPVHAVTGAGGTFRIDRFPVGRDIELHAWHPLFEDTTIRVDVTAGQTSHVELTIRPAPPPPTPPPTPDTPGPAEDQPGLF